MARFDWYQATVPVEPAVLLGALEGLADGRPELKVLERAPYGYSSAWLLSDMDGPLVRVWAGGMHTHPHVVCSGEAAPGCADLLRGEFPGHTVSRADVCIDYADPGAYDRLQGLALQVARDRRIKVGTAGDHLLTMEGRTLMLGATSSHTRLRLYDKAAELRAKFDGQFERLASIPAELARFECQVRPATPEAKRAAAQADPVSLMGSAAWMRELMRLVSGLELEPFQAARVWRQTDDARSYAAVLAQYGGLFKRIFADLGSWDLVGRQLGDDLAERAAAAKRRGR